MAVSIFDIAGVTPTQSQAERIADEDLAMSMPFNLPPSGTSKQPTLASLSKQAYDIQRNEQRARQAQLPQVLGISAAESLERFGTKEYEGQVKNVVPMQEIYGRMQSEGQLPPIGIGGLLSNPIGNFANAQIFDALQKGGRPIYGNGQLQGVMLNGRYTGASAFDPNAKAFETHDMYKEQPEVVLPEYDPELDAKKCPDGYIFDENLQACRLDVSVPNLPDQTFGQRDFYEVPYQPSGLLDEGGYEFGVPLIYG